MAEVVRRSEDLARLAPEDPEYLPPPGPQAYPHPRRYFDDTAGITPAYRSAAAGASIDVCRQVRLVAAGFLENTTGFQALMTSRGLFGYDAATGVDFSVTVRTGDGKGAGYAARDAHRAALLDTAAATRLAADKALRSVDARALPPGQYTVILEPAASVGLLQNLLFNMDARQADEGRSFLSRTGGGTLLGERIADARVVLYSDPTHPDVPSAPWDAEGVPHRRTVWIEKGVVRNLAYSRYWARHQGKAPVPLPGSFIMEGTDASLADLIAGTRRGILVTRTWYIRSVDPQTLLYTGLTRDGTFWIEDGNIAFPIKNFRFNESPVTMLNQVDALGKPERTGGNLIPPMKIRDFTFSSLSDAV